LYHKHHEEAQKLERVKFIGRLGLYCYLKMDVVVEKSLYFLFQTIGKARSIRSISDKAFFLWR
jgi:UDP-galactopyranose mutase